MPKLSRRELLHRSGGAVALGSTVALAGYAVAQMPAPDPALRIAAEWNTARDNLLELLKDTRESDERLKRWQTNAMALEDAGERLRQIQPTTLAGAAAVLAISVYCLDPEGLARVHYGFVRGTPTLEWLRGAHAALRRLAGRAS